MDGEGFWWYRSARRMKAGSSRKSRLAKCVGKCDLLVPTQGDRHRAIEPPQRPRKDRKDVNCHQASQVPVPRVSRRALGNRRPFTSRDRPGLQSRRRRDCRGDELQLQHCGDRADGASGGGASRHARRPGNGRTRQAVITETIPLATPNLSNTCGGSATAVAGAGAVSLSGGTLAGSASSVST